MTTALFYWPERWCTVAAHDGKLYHGALATRTSDGKEGVYHMTSNTFVVGNAVERVGLRTAVAQWALPLVYRRLDDADDAARTVFESTLVILSEREDPREDEDALNVAMDALERSRARLKAPKLSGFPPVSLVSIRSTVETVV